MKMLLKLLRDASADAELLTEPPAEPLAVAELDPVTPDPSRSTLEVNDDLAGSALMVAVLPRPLTVTSFVAFLSRETGVVVSVDLNVPLIAPSADVVEPTAPLTSLRVEDPKDCLKLLAPDELVTLMPSLEVLDAAPKPKAAELLTEYSEVEDAEAFTPILVEVPTANLWESPSTPLNEKVPVLPPEAPVVMVVGVPSPVDV